MQTRESRFIQVDVGAGTVGASAQVVELAPSLGRQSRGIHSTIITAEELGKAAVDPPQNQKTPA
ncbi:MAG: hypothetical protein ABWY37_07385 [Microbacterium pygmaeum]